MDAHDLAVFRSTRRLRRSAWGAKEPVYRSRPQSPAAARPAPRE